MNKTISILIISGSIISIGFGIWHFFVPGIWNWYSYIDQKATELVLAIRAINFFFSLLLVLLGIANVIFVCVKSIDKIARITLFSISSFLWASRIVMQIIYPQGSQNPILQNSMFSVFVLTFLCFSIALLYLITNKSLTENVMITIKNISRKMVKLIRLMPFNDISHK